MTFHRLANSIASFPGDALKPYLATVAFVGKIQLSTKKSTWGRQTLLKRLVVPFNTMIVKLKMDYYELQDHAVALENMIEEVADKCNGVFISEYSPEMDKWCEENIPSFKVFHYFQTSALFTFNTSDDAIMFSLKWK